MPISNKDKASILVDLIICSLAQFRETLEYEQKGKYTRISKAVLFVMAKKKIYKQLKYAPTEEYVQMCVYTSQFNLHLYM